MNSKMHAVEKASCVSKWFFALVMLMFFSSMLSGCGGQSQKNVSNTPSDTPSNVIAATTWTFCAKEDGVCTFSGTTRVRYGLNGQYAIQTATGSIGCNNQVFGDPVVGADKICEYETDTTQPPPSDVNPVTLENAKPGSTAWQLTNPALNGEIEGYASLTSVPKGGSLNLYVNTDAASYRMDIYRMGYYDGKGARLMQSVASLPGQSQPKPCLNSSGVIECDWSVSRTLTIPNDVQDPASDLYWASGIYLVKLTTNDSRRKDSYIIFVVRDDARAATYVAQLPDTTYQAYNYWGGKSLYTGCVPHNYNWTCNDGRQPSPTVSYNRPYGPSTNADAAYGVGAGEFITNVQPVLAGGESSGGQGYPISSAGFDYNMVRWMERQGYDVKYISNIDLHQRPDFFAGSKAFISMGHDEYYSRTMRDRLISARDVGINLAFFSGNQVYWQVRFNNGQYGSDKTDRNMTCYRLGGDPVTDPMLRTGRFRDLGTPEAEFLGAQYVTDPVMGDISITNATHWLFTGSGATNSTILRGLLGYEINAIVNGVSPDNVVSLAHSTYNGFGSDMTYYIALSKAQVFGTGTIQWSWGLDSFISNGLRPDYTSSIAQKITDNVFRMIAERDLFRLQNNAGGLYLNVPSNVSGPALTVLGAIPSNNSKTDQWRVLSYSDGSYQVVSRATGLCLDAYGANDSSPVGTWECNGLPHQRWRFIATAGDKFMLSDQRSQRCVTGTSGNLTLQTCSGSTSQQWQQLSF